MSRPPIRRRSIPPASIRDVIRREKDVLAEKAKAQGKPANVIEKIVEFGLKTFYKEVCLLDQAFIHDPTRSVAQAVKEAEGKVGAPIKITGFVRYALGEGIERPDTRFRRRSGGDRRSRTDCRCLRPGCTVGGDRERSERIGASASWPSRSTDASS